MQRADRRRERFLSGCANPSAGTPGDKVTSCRLQKCCVDIFSARHDRRYPLLGQVLGRRRGENRAESVTAPFRRFGAPTKSTSSTNRGVGGDSWSSACALVSHPHPVRHVFDDVSLAKTMPAARSLRDFALERSRDPHQHEIGHAYEDDELRAALERTCACDPSRFTATIPWRTYPLYSVFHRNRVARVRGGRDADAL